MNTTEKPSPTGKRVELNLTQTEQTALECQTKSARRDEADRARIILKLASGQTSQQVAQHLDLHPAAIRRIKRRFLAYRTAGIPTRKPTGRPPAKRAVILAWVTNQEQCGRLQEPQRGILSAREIAESVFAHSHVRVSVGAVRLALKKGGIATKESDIA